MLRSDSNLLNLTHCRRGGGERGRERGGEGGRRREKEEEGGRGREKRMGERERERESRRVKMPSEIIVTTETTPR